METPKRPLLLNQLLAFPLSIIEKLGAKYHEHTTCKSGYLFTYFLRRSLRIVTQNNTYF